MPLLEPEAQLIFIKPPPRYKNMDLLQLKEILNKAGFTKESLEVMNQILDTAIRQGSLTKEEKNKLLAVIDLEMETGNLEAEAMEKAAAALEAFAKEVDQLANEAEKSSSGPNA